MKLNDHTETEREERKGKGEKGDGVKVYSAYVVIDFANIFLL